MCQWWLSDCSSNCFHTNPYNYWTGPVEAEWKWRWMLLAAGLTGRWMNPAIASIFACYAPCKIQSAVTGISAFLCCQYVRIGWALKGAAWMSADTCGKVTWMWSASSSTISQHRLTISGPVFKNRTRNRTARLKLLDAGLDSILQIKSLVIWMSEIHLPQFAFISPLTVDIQLLSQFSWHVLVLKELYF